MAAQSEMLDDSDGEISLMTESSVDDQDDLRFVAEAPCCVAAENSEEGLDSEDDFGTPIGDSPPRVGQLERRLSSGLVISSNPCAEQKHTVTVGEDCARAQTGPPASHSDMGGSDTVYHWVGELLKTVPELRAANSKWKLEVDQLNSRLREAQKALEDAHSDHDTQRKRFIEQAAANLKRELEECQRNHRQEIVSEQAERVRLEDLLRLKEQQNQGLAAEVEMLQSQKDAIHAATARQLADRAAEKEDLKMRLRENEEALAAEQQRVHALQLQHAQDRHVLQREGDQLRAHVAELQAVVGAFQDQQERCERVTALALRSRDPDGAYVARSPLLDMEDPGRFDDPLAPAAHRLWQA